MPEITRVFLVTEAAMARRITRSEDKVKTARIPYRVPSAEDVPARVTGVLAVLYLVFNEGYLATGADADPVRPALTAEAIRLARLVWDLLPHDGEAAGLLALMLLTDARRVARVAHDGALVALGEQDRSDWDVAVIAEGHRLVRERPASGQAPGPYRVFAAINAVHTSAREARDTDWGQIVALYDQLVEIDPSPVVALNRPWPSARWMVRRWGRRPSTCSAPRWPATTISTPPAQSCSAGWAASKSPAPRTRGRSSWLRIRPRPLIWNGG